MAAFFPAEDGVEQKGGTTVAAERVAIEAGLARGPGAKASVTAPEGEGQRIYDAAKAGDVGSLRALVQEWIGNDVLNWAITDASNENEYGNTPLVASSFDAKIEVVRLLLATPGVDANKGDTENQTPVMWAAEKGHTDVVRVLLAAPSIDVNKADNDGWTPVMWAAEKGHIDVVRVLLAAPSIDVNGASSSEGVTALVLAAKHGRTDVVGALLDAPRIDINKADKYGRTAVGEAACEGHTDIVRSLLAAPGIDVNSATNNGEAALHWAAHNGHTEVVRTLLAPRPGKPAIDLNKRVTGVWSRGKTALGMAIANDKPEIAALLRAAGAEE